MLKKVLMVDGHKISRETSIELSHNILTFLRMTVMRVIMVRKPLEIFYVLIVNSTQKLAIAKV